MTLQEAIKSGKPFRRSGQDEVCQYFKAGEGPYADKGLKSDYFLIDGEFSTSLDLYQEDILATDWEVKEGPRTYYIVHIPGKSPEAFASEAYAKNFAKKHSNVEVIKVTEVIE